MNYDSTDVDLLYKYAESLRKYNNYPKAAHYYAKVYDKDRGRTYKKSPFWLADMYKQMGEYKDAVKYWKKANTLSKRDKKSYEYLKSKQEVTSTNYARRNYKYYIDAEVKSVGDKINTYDSEFAPVWKDSTLYFSSLRAENIRGNVVDDPNYMISVYQSKQNDESWDESKEVDGKINELISHNANSTFTDDVVYFSRCNEVFKCKVYEGKLIDGKIKDIKKLDENINLEGSTSTHPYACDINGKKVLLFVSDREGGQGQLDIWYSEKKGNKFSKPINLGKKINTPDNDITPFYDPLYKEFFFSSTWHKGFGGFDVFKSTGDLKKLSAPQNMKRPVNSYANDLYFHFLPQKNQGFLASNRKGSLSKKGETCCNDIYHVSFPERQILDKEDSVELAIQSLNDFLPTLYFHNDEPDPRTTDTVTRKNYISTYNSYKKLLPKYRIEYSKGLDEEEAQNAMETIDDFFTDQVDQGVEDLNEFTPLLLAQLKQGQKIELTIKGFASPLAKTDYNVKLTGRRISSLINYFNEYQGGVYRKYINGTASNGGKLTFVKIPFGEYRAEKFTSDNLNDKRNSVYSKAAAIERKIEIISVKLAKEKEVFAKIALDKEIHDFGAVKKGDVLHCTFQITNSGTEKLIVDNLSPDCECIQIDKTSFEIEANQSIKVNVTINTAALEDKEARFINIKSNAIQQEKQLSITLEVQDY